MICGAWDHTVCQQQNNQIAFHVLKFRFELLIYLNNFLYIFHL